MRYEPEFRGNFGCLTRKIIQQWRREIKEGFGDLPMWDALHLWFRHLLLLAIVARPAAPLVREN